MPAVLEVEQKFCLTDAKDIENRLIQEGFTRDSTFEMVDWYFDTQPYSLTLQDCWLRYRESTENVDNDDSTPRWQLKRGSKSGHQRQTTVYEETEDTEAVTLAYSLIRESLLLSKSVRENASDDFKGHLVPKLPVSATPAPRSLEPFARICTQRSRWKVQDSSNQFAKLVVDLDSTDYGHAVGEVEMVVESDEQVVEARVLIQKFLKQVIYDGIDTSQQAQAEGKLGFYLSRFRPVLYEALVEAGVMR